MDGLRLEWIDPKTLTPNAKNWRRHPVAQREALEGVLEEVGWAGAALYNERTGRLVDGHLRLDVAMRRGDEAIPVLVGSWSDAQEAEILATLDPIAAMAEADSAQLDALLQEVSTGSAAVMDMLSDLAENAGLYQDKPIGAGGDEFDTTPEDGPTRTQAGDLWQLGDHRLIVGDSTDRATVERLMNGERADMVFTDPPYGNDLGYGRGQLGERYIAGDDSLKALEALFPLCDEWLKPDTHCLIWIQWRTFSALESAFASYKLRTVVVWDKKQPGLSGGGFAEQHEWMCVFIKGHATQSEYCGNVWSMSRENHFGGRVDHPTMKPVELQEKAIDLCSECGAIVADWFGGSGSTLIACERTGRACRIVEIEPKYADVILRRWEAETGEEAVLVERIDELTVLK